MVDAPVEAKKRAPRRVRPKRPIWMERPSFAVQGTKAIVLAIVFLMMVFPFFYIIVVSLASEKDIIGGGLILWPAHPTFTAYISILTGGIVGRALLVSVGITLVGTFVSMALTVTLAHGLTRIADVPGAKVMLFLVLGTLLFTAGIIPNYLLVKQLGLLNTYWSLILPVGINAFNLVVIRQFFLNIPRDVLDCARMDGANELQLLRHFMLPLSKAVLAVIALFYAVGYWNDYFNALIYLNSSDMWPIQLVLRQYVLEGTPLTTLQGNPDLSAIAPPPQTFQMAVVVLATAPILLVYPFLQRYFTKGVLTGAIKG